MVGTYRHQADVRMGQLLIRYADRAHKDVIQRLGRVRAIWTKKASYLVSLADQRGSSRGLYTCADGSTVDSSLICRSDTEILQSNWVEEFNVNAYRVFSPHQALDGQTMR